MIALVHGAPVFGAVERYVLAVARGLVGSEEPAALLFPDDPALAPFAELDGALELVRMPNGLAEDASASASFVRRELRRLRPRVVHVTDVWPPGLVAARLAGVQRLLMTHHTPELPRTDNLAGRAWLAAGWLARPQVIYTSETDRRTDGRRLLHTHVVPLGIDLERFVRAPHEPDPVAPTIGNVARLATQKGQRTLIDAIPLVLTRYPGARFVVVGDGELREALVGQSERLGVTDHVTFAGERTDIPELLASFDVFAFPSLFEGLCLAVIEAQAAGVPVVATPVGGIRETVVPGETGLLVQPEDPAALARAVVELLDDPVGANTLAVEAQRRVLARFSESEMVGRTLELYGRPA